MCGCTLYCSADCGCCCHDRNRETAAHLVLREAIRSRQQEADSTRKRLTALESEVAVLTDALAALR